MSVTVGINHVTSITPDLDRMVRFYADVFGAEKVFERPETGVERRMAIVELGAGRYVKVVEEPTGDIGHAVRTTTERFGLAVESVSALRTLRERMVRAGVPVDEIQRLPTQWVLVFDDPDGTVLQVCAHARAGDPTDPARL